jgi:cysteine desulfurase
MEHFKASIDSEAQPKEKMPVEDPIYLDYNASAPALPRVREAMVRALTEGFGNPSAEHVYGRRARAFITKAREQVAALLGCDADEIVFTGGGTESSNLAIRGFEGDPRRLALAVSALEHPATLEPAQRLERAGASVRVAPAQADGTVAPDAMIAALREAMDAVRSKGEEPRGLVSVILAQNETGVLQPVQAIAAEARALGAAVHADAAQAVGKVPVSVRDLGASMLSVAGHKLYAPKGVGALYVRRGIALAPVLVGAGHERGLRPGTENVPAIAALGEACAAALEDLEAEARRQEALRDRLEALLRQGGYEVHGAAAPRLPNTSNGRFPGVRGSELMRRSPEIAFSTGSACHAGEEHPSRVLLAMGIAGDDALGAVRLTLGRGTSEAMIDQAAALLLERSRGG